MAGPLAVPAAAQSAVKVLTTDIVKVEGKIFRRIRKKIPLVDANGNPLLTKKGRVRYARIDTLEPIDVSVHANPVGLGALAAAVAVGAGILFGRLKLGVLGIGEVELYKGPLADEFDAWKGRYLADREARRNCEEMGGIWDPRSRVCTIPGTLECADLCRLYKEAREDRRYTDARRYALQMKDRGCPPCE